MFIERFVRRRPCFLSGALARVGRVVRLPLHISMHHACDTTDVAAAAAAATAAATDDDDDDDGRGDTNMK